jgi:hypothetical protein
LSNLNDEDQERRRPGTTTSHLGFLHLTPLSAAA